MKNPISFRATPLAIATLVLVLCGKTVYSSEPDGPVEEKDEFVEAPLPKGVFQSERYMGIIVSPGEFPDTGMIQEFHEQFERTIQAFRPNVRFRPFENFPDKREGELETEPKAIESTEENYPREGVIYKVEEGDTIFSIANDQNSKPSWIVQANRLKGADSLKEGETLFIPIKKIIFNQSELSIPLAPPSLTP